MKKYILILMLVVSSLGYGETKEYWRKKADLYNNVLFQKGSDYSEQFSGSLICVWSLYESNATRSETQGEMTIKNLIILDNETIVSVIYIRDKPRYLNTITNGKGKNMKWSLDDIQTIEGMESKTGHKVVSVISIDQLDSMVSIMKKQIK